MSTVSLVEPSAGTDESTAVVQAEVLRAILAQIPATVPQTIELYQSQHRDLGVDAATAAAHASRDFAKFLMVALDLANKLVPTIIDHVKDSRDLDVATRDSEAFDRGLGALLGAVLPTALEFLPLIVKQLSGKRDAEVIRLTDEDATSRWILPLITTLAPMLLQAAPGIIAAVKKR